MVFFYKSISCSLFCIYVKVVTILSRKNVKSTCIYMYRWSSTCTTMYMYMTNKARHVCIHFGLTDLHNIDITKHGISWILDNFYRMLVSNPHCTWTAVWVTRHLTAWLRHYCNILRCIYSADIHVCTWTWLYRRDILDRVILMFVLATRFISTWAICEIISEI